MIALKFEIYNLNTKFKESENKSKQFQNELEMKNDEIKNYLNEVNQLNKILYPNNPIIDSEEQKITIFVTSMDQTIINHPLKCKNSDLFFHIEEKLYDVYPIMKDKTTYFMLKGNIIQRFKTIEENNIKNNDLLILNEYQF